jgi:hypothetical protein
MRRMTPAAILFDFDRERRRAGRTVIVAFGSHRGAGGSPWPSRPSIASETPFCNQEPDMSRADQAQTPRGLRRTQLYVRLRKYGLEPENGTIGNVSPEGSHS